MFFRGFHRRGRSDCVWGAGSAVKSVLMLGASILAPQAITFISESIILLIRATGRIIGSPTVALSCVAMFLCAAALTVCAILNKRRCSCELDPRGLTEYYLFLFVPLLGALWTVLSYVVYIPQASGAITFADPVRFYDTTKLIVAILSAAVMVGVVVMLSAAASARRAIFAASRLRHIHSLG